MMTKYITTLILLTFVLGIKVQTTYLRKKAFNENMLCILQNKGCSSSFSASEEASIQLYNLFAKEHNIKATSLSYYSYFIKSFSIIHDYTNSLQIKRKNDNIAIEFIDKNQIISFEFSQDGNKVCLERIDNIKHLKSIITCIIET